jgi:hypothetical protein
MRYNEIIKEAFQMDSVTRRWFDGSKVVDIEGKPLPVYHGTNQPIDKFSKERKGMNSSHPTAKTGFFFTDNPEIASDYAALAGRNVRADVSTHEKKSERLQKETDRLERIAQRTGKNEDWDAYSRAAEEFENLEIGSLRDDPLIGQNVVPVYLKIVNPMVLDAKGNSINDIDGTYLGDIITRAKALKNDGVIIHNLNDAPTMNILCTHYIVFSPNQIKSVFTGKPKVTEGTEKKYFYHATVAPHIDGIFKSGLLPNTDREKNWNFRDSPENVIFLADNAKVAFNYGKLVSDNHYNNLGWESKPFVVILRTLRKNVKNPTRGENEYYTKFPISSNKLEILIHGEWKPLLSAKKQVDNIADGSWDWSEEDDENNDNADEYYKDMNENTKQKTLPIPATQDNIVKAKTFVLKKWQERAAERGKTVDDLSNACKFSSMFAQRIFGGTIQGNYDHQYLVLSDRVIDLNDDAMDVQKMSNPYRHDKSFFGKKDYKASMKSCEPRVEKWVEEFIRNNTLKFESVMPSSYYNTASMPVYNLPPARKLSGVEYIGNTVVYLNPSVNDFSKLMQQSLENKIRIMVASDNLNFAAWPAYELTHDEVSKKIPEFAGKNTNYKMYGREGNPDNNFPLRIGRFGATLLDYGGNPVNLYSLKPVLRKALNLPAY